MQICQATEFGAACTQQSSYYAGDSKKCQGSTRGVCLGYSEDRVRFQPHRDFKPLFDAQRVASISGRLLLHLTCRTV